MLTIKNYFFTSFIFILIVENVSFAQRKKNSIGLEMQYAYPFSATYNDNGDIPIDMSIYALQFGVNVGIDPTQYWGASFGLGVAPVAYSANSVKREGLLLTTQLALRYGRVISGFEIEGSFLYAPYASMNVASRTSAIINGEQFSHASVSSYKSSSGMGFAAAAKKEYIGWPFTLASAKRNKIIGEFILGLSYINYNFHQAKTQTVSSKGDKTNVTESINSRLTLWSIILGFGTQR